MDKQNRVLDLFGRTSYSAFSTLTPITSFVVSDPSKEVLILPSNIGILPKYQLFSVFNKQHMKEATTVYNFLISLKSFADFLTAAGELKGQLNGGLFLYALAVAFVHRDDTREIRLPPLWQVSPYSFIESSTVNHALDKARLPETVDATGDAPSFVTGTVRDPEHKVAWWREDIGLNSHHTHWHQVYPWAGVTDQGTDTPHTKDRQGELFYYMHHQMLARYDAERMAVGLMRVVAYEDWSRPIQEGYDSHLTDYYGRKQYTPRPSGMILADNYTDPINPTLVSSTTYHYHRLLDAIVTGKFEKSNGSKETVNIVNLGAAVESSISSPNPLLYGSVHNIGHDLSSVITDPDGRYKQSMGVMGDTTTACRDPFFFRWHKFIDSLFVQHKNQLTPYGKEELTFSSVTLKDVSVLVNKDGSKKNELTTRMETTDIDISEAMFFHKENSNVMVEVTRASHDEFKYDIAVEAKEEVKAAFRIFIAPKLDEHGQQMTLETQKRLFIETDKFVKTLSPGQNQIHRSSLESSVIKPQSKTFDEIRKESASSQAKGDCSCRKDRYCECGWPENLLLPRGTVSGMTFDLFVMVTDWAADSITDNLDQGTSYCGIKNEKYPDSRAMGFPFDRVIDDNFFTIKEQPKSLDTFTGQFENMFSVPITISFQQ